MAYPSQVYLFPSPTRTFPGTEVQTQSDPNPVPPVPRKHYYIFRRGGRVIRVVR